MNPRAWPPMLGYLTLSSMLSSFWFTSTDYKPAESIIPLQQFSIVVICPQGSSEKSGDILVIITARTEGGGKEYPTSAGKPQPWTPAKYQ